jgi:hypothetical protein
MHLQHIQSKIYEIRKQKIMLDFDLAELYQVETRILNQAVKRNSARFPADFMFQLTEKEWLLISSQIVMTSTSKRPKSALPYAFTEQGLAMLSGVLHSEKAIQVNISIMRAFVVLREFAISNKELTQKLKEIEGKYDKQFKDVYEAINFLLQKDNAQQAQQKRKRLGYKLSV